MDQQTTVARPYAKAIFDIGSADHSITSWINTLKQLSAITQNDDFMAFSAHPHQNTASILTFIRELLQPSDYPKGFLPCLELLITNKRLKAVPAIVDLLQTYEAQQLGVIHATVETPFGLNEAQINDLTHLLAEKYNKKVLIETVIKENLIGGVRIIIGDDVIDSSIRGKLNQMANHLKN
jgi:F-type H+-transporting ATPase subunit delta